MEKTLNEFKWSRKASKKEMVLYFLSTRIIIPCIFFISLKINSIVKKGWKKRLEKEEKHCECVRKKYNRVQIVFQNVCVGSGSLSIILSMSGLGTSLSGFGIIVGLPLGVIGGFCGLISIISGGYSNKLGKKVSKHERTSTIAKSKINTIKELISKALKDEKISDEEFSLIIKEVDKFEE